MFLCYRSWMRDLVAILNILLKKFNFWIRAERNEYLSY